MERPLDFRVAGLPPADETAIREILGYLNFSNGTPDPAVQRNFNRLHLLVAAGQAWGDQREMLLERLTQLQADSGTFADSEQARAVIGLVFDHLHPAYRRFHADLLFHLKPEEFEQPFLLAKMFEAVLSQGGPWNETDRIVAGAIDQLNDFVGYRPVAVLENDRKMQPYEHERFRPVPIYLRGAGIAVGKYAELLERTLSLLETVPPDLLLEAHFDLSLVDELAVDVRAHDHLHPVYKRTNYMFGEWDPHVIDNQGRYRRFVIRQLILDFLLLWIENSGSAPREELVEDAAAVLCGTMLMASSISGWGPGAHDSSVTLTSLLPRVARQRDAFYARLLEAAHGARAERLQAEARLTQQPFGHVRQHLNMTLAHYGAAQVQYRHLAELFARMGFPEASRETAAVIPSPAARFESEIRWRISAAHLKLDAGDVPAAAPILYELEDLLTRGIHCGALMDPWNFLAFQGQFPLFSSREDSVPDQRAEVLLELMESIFDVLSKALAEAGARGERQLESDLSQRFLALAEHWDRYATSAVSDLPAVVGRESWESATHVARALSEWRAAGEAAGDISFWRRHVEQFQSARAYAQVVDVLLRQNDRVAALGLLMQWLSQVDEVGLESGIHSFHSLVVRWLRQVTADDLSWPLVRKMFDYLEANAGTFWTVPNLDDVEHGLVAETDEENLSELAAEAVDPDAEADDEDDLYSAAYDNVIYRDSADDGRFGELMDDGVDRGDDEFDELNRELEPRLRFLHTLAQLWQITAAACAADAGVDDELAQAVAQWRERTGSLQRSLGGLMDSAWNRGIPVEPGDHDLNVEFDMQLQSKYYLLHTMIVTHVACRSAQRLLDCCLPDNKRRGGGTASEERPLVRVCRGVLSGKLPQVREHLPKLLMELVRHPLLYVPLEHGGAPPQVRESRNVLSVLRFLLSQLPRLGLLRETWHVLKTAHRMERVARPNGLSVTEFDRLFRSALRNSLDCLIRSSHDWKVRRSAQDKQPRHFSDEELCDAVGDLVQRYHELWLKHSRGMRLSSVESLGAPEVWTRIVKFIERYGADLLHAEWLTLGQVRTVLHAGVDEFLKHLAERRDPLHPIKLLEDIDKGTIDREDAVECLELIYSAVVDSYDRYLEYCTTTTQSDYGEKFHCLLDFLRLEASYERDAWNLIPVVLAHEELSALGRQDAALLWEEQIRENTREVSQAHIDELRRLERRYGMRLPAISDRIHERFVKPLAVNRMQAKIAPAMEDARAGRQDGAAFATLRAEIEAYLDDTSGSAVDVPAWLVNLDKEVDRWIDRMDRLSDTDETEVARPPLPLSYLQFRKQLSTWNQPLRSRPPRKT